MVKSAVAARRRSSSPVPSRLGAMAKIQPQPADTCCKQRFLTSPRHLRELLSTPWNVRPWRHCGWDRWAPSSPRCDPERRCPPAFQARRRRYTSVPQRLQKMTASQNWRTKRYQQIPTNTEGSLKLGIRLPKLWTHDLKNKRYDLGIACGFPVARFK